MKCAVCPAATAANLNSGDNYDQPSQGQQGDPHSPQPTLDCTTTNTTVDAAASPAKASLTSYTQGLKNVGDYQASVVATTSPILPQTLGEPCKPSLSTVPHMHI